MSVSQTNISQMQAIIARVRAAGVVVYEQPGLYSRSASGSFHPQGVIDHHDASTRKSGEWGSLGYILSGSPIAPLAQFQGARCLDGVPKIAACAAGRCNHAGKGGPYKNIPRDSANMYMYGVEWANDGLGEPYTESANFAKNALFQAILEVVT